MKKIEGKSQGKSYKSVRLYREDLDDIVTLLSKHADRVEITDDDYTYDSLDELKLNRGLTPKKLKINSYSPYISLEFKRDIPAIWFYRGDSDQKSVYLYHSIDQILNKRLILFSKILPPAFSIMFFIFSIVLLLFTPADTLKYYLPQIWQRVALLILVFGIPAISLLARIGVFYSIVLKTSHEQGNFFQRQKDDLIKILIGAIIGGVITYLLTRLAK